MPTYTEKEKIRNHYDLISPYYFTLWGEHLHHGYWIHGDEPKEKAQVDDPRGRKYGCTDQGRTAS